VLLILNALLLNVISSIASCRLNCKLVSDIAHVRDDLNKKEGQREFPRLDAWKALIVAVAVRSKRALIERMSVIYSESIINLLSVARAEQHRPLRETEKRRNKRSKIENRMCVVRAELCREWPRGYGKKIICVHQYLNEFRRSENEASPSEFRTDPHLIHSASIRDYNPSNWR